MKKKLLAGKFRINIMRIVKMTWSNLIELIFSLKSL